jgi:MraZ protein
LPRPKAGKAGVDERAYYLGNGLSAVDGKSRSVIPAALRHPLERNGDGKFLFIALHPTDPCLIAYDRNWSQAQVQQLREDEAADRAAGIKVDRANINRVAFGATDEVGYDASGRFVIPDFYRDYANLTSKALFIGTGDVFEIWDPQTLIDTPGVDDRIRKLAQFHMKPKKGAA